MARTLNEQLVEREKMRSMGWKWSGEGTHFYRDTNGPVVAMVDWSEREMTWIPAAYHTDNWNHWLPEVSFESAIAAASYGEVMEWGAL